MLPYSPLHHLLLADTGPLVMKSGNVSDEPIVFRDEEALERLAAIADLLLLHDRPIETRTDDSVLRVSREAARTVMLRRSRGYVPASLPLETSGAPALLACGAELKNTFCLARDGRAWVSHHIGDLENLETLTSFREGIEHFKRLWDALPIGRGNRWFPTELANRLRKNAKRIGTWAKKNGITCFRIYDRDLTSVPLALDLYETEDGDRWLHGNVFEPRHGIETAAIDRWLQEARDTLEISPERTVVKRRASGETFAQYGKRSDTGHRLIVRNEADVRSKTVSESVREVNERVPVLHS